MAAGVTADHLYSYAKQGIHQNEGVLLIPPDLPSLFVACLPKVEIAPAKITLDPILKKTPSLMESWRWEITSFADR